MTKLRKNQDKLHSKSNNPVIITATTEAIDKLGIRDLISKSNCCKAKMLITEGDEGMNYYCLNCRKACDPFPDRKPCICKYTIPHFMTNPKCPVHGQPCTCHCHDTLHGNLCHATIHDSMACQHCDPRKPADTNPEPSSQQQEHIHNNALGVFPKDCEACINKEIADYPVGRVSEEKHSTGDSPPLDQGTQTSVPSNDNVNPVKTNDNLNGNKPASNEKTWEEIKKNLGLYLWGRRVELRKEHDALKTADMLMPFIADIIAQTKQQQREEFLEMVGEDENLTLVPEPEQSWIVAQTALKEYLRAQLKKGNQ